MLKAKFAAFFVITGLLSGCVSFEKNAFLSQHNPSEGYRYSNVNEKSKNNSDSLFVVLSFSGGGTRAAALSYGILQELKATKIVWEGKEKSLLNEVDIISSVSGGSFTSAFYGLNREKIFEGWYENDYLKKDIQKGLALLLLNPINWYKLASPSFGRSDLVNEYYQRNIFGTKTFGDLLNKGKPFLMINGTDMSTGAQFPFIQDQFDLLCSDLSKYPVSRAVATSSAFPGLLTPLTYKNYAGKCQYQEPEWVKNAANSTPFNPQSALFVDDRRSYYETPSYRKRRDYVHMMDGGVADNIGLRSLTFGVQNSGPEYSIQRMINNREIKKLVVIVVNAATDPDNDLDQSTSVPGVITTVTTASTVPLDNYTFDTLNSSKDAIGNYKEQRSLLAACNRQLKKQCPSVEPIGIPPATFDSYVSMVSFNNIQDAEKRYWFKNLPTNFDLTTEQVDALLKEGKSLLRESRDYQNLVNAIGADNASRSFPLNP